MFIQVIQGKVADRAGLQAANERWAAEVKPGATGWLGATGGIADDDTFVMTVRFESAEAARRNSERPEQSAWWAETSKCLEGDVTFVDCPEVTQWLQGGSDDAGFVQVIEGKTEHPDRLRELLDRYGDEIQKLRPELIGATIALHGDGAFVQTVYFTSEQEAREHEALQPPADLAEALAEEQDLMQDTSYIDLHTPWLLSASR